MIWRWRWRWSLGRLAARVVNLRLLLLALIICLAWRDEYHAGTWATTGSSNLMVTQHEFFAVGILRCYTELGRRAHCREALRFNLASLALCGQTIEYWSRGIDLGQSLAVWCLRASVLLPYCDLSVRDRALQEHVCRLNAACLSLLRTISLSGHHVRDVLFMMVMIHTLRQAGGDWI